MAGGAARGGRHPADQQRRGCHELRDARDGAADARVRSGEACRAGDSRPPRAREGRDRDDRRRDARRSTRRCSSSPTAIAPSRLRVSWAAPRPKSPRARRAVALESAWFLPNTVRATSRKLGLKTEASARFERGADIEAPVHALRRAIAPAAGDRRGADRRRHHGRLPAPVRAATVDARPRSAGASARRHDSRRRTSSACSSRSDFDSNGRPTDGAAMVPSFRVDVHRDADLIEDVGRHWGFDRIPSTFPALRAVPRASDAVLATGRLTRRLLSGAGLQEAVTFTFIDGQAAAPFATEAALLPIKNPLSEKFAVLRPSLVPGLVDALVYNQNRQAADVQLFELGSVFSKQAGERLCVGWVMTGSRGEHWSGSAGAIEFADTKGVADLVSTRVWPRRRRAAGGRSCHGWRRARAPIWSRPMARRSAGSAGSPPCADRTPTCTPARSIWIWPDARPRRVARRSVRCRASRRSCAICRSSSTNACQPRTFVARFGRTHQPRSWLSASSIGIEAKACLPVGSVCRCGSRSRTPTAR